MCSWLEYNVDNGRLIIRDRRYFVRFTILSRATTRSRPTQFIGEVVEVEVVISIANIILRRFCKFSKNVIGIWWISIFRECVRDDASFQSDMRKTEQACNQSRIATYWSRVKIKSYIYHMYISSTRYTEATNSIYITIPTEKFQKTQRTTNF